MSVFCIFLSSSRSTKLTEDMGSLQSVCPASGLPGPPEPPRSHLSYSHPSSASYSMSLDQGGILTAQEATEYLELCPKPERHRYVSCLLLLHQLMFNQTWPSPSLSAVLCQSSILPCPGTSPPPTSPRVTPSPWQSPCVTPDYRARRRPATASGTALCGTPGAQWWTVTSTAPAPASSAQWTAATPTTAPPLLICWRWRPTTWVEPLWQVAKSLYFKQKKSIISTEIKLNAIFLILYTTYI